MTDNHKRTKEKNMKKLLLTLATFAAAGFAFAQDAPPPPPEGGPGAPPPPPRGERPPFRPEQQIKMVENGMKRVLEAYDKNKDGKLDGEEKALADKELDPKELQKKMTMARGYERFVAIDTNGDGVLSEEEKAEAPEKLKKLMERNMPGRPGGPEGRFGRPGGPEGRFGRPGGPEGRGGRPGGRPEGRPGRPGGRGGRPGGPKDGDNGNPPPPPPEED